MLKIVRENRRLRKENVALKDAIKEALRELNDADCLNKSIVIMSASIRLERALEKDPKERPLKKDPNVKKVYQHLL